MDTITVMARFFQEGGIFMYPILIVLALGVAIAVERYMFLTRSQKHNIMMWEQLIPVVKKGDFQQALTMASKSTVDVGRVLTYGLTRMRGAKKREEIETAMEEGLMEIMPRLEKRTHYLSTFANIATLLGLLGTIIGLIQAFTAVANANPAEKADLLSQSISVAMNTTAFGLIVAIPLLLTYTLLQTKTTELVDSLEMASVKFLNIIMEKSATPSTGA